MSVKKSFAKLEQYLLGRNTRPGLLARDLVGKEKPEDTKLAELLVNERRTATRMDGSIGGSVLATAWAAWEMMDLGADPLHGGLNRLISWLLTRLEGGDGSPDSVPLTLPNGAVYQDPDHAAYATRCLGLRALMRARQGHRPGVASLLEGFATGPQPPTIDLSASVLSALALAPMPHHRHLEGLVHRLGKAQARDGSWPGADLFHVLDGLVLAGIKPARGLIAQAAPALIARQHPDGAFDQPAHEERAWIAFRALHIALEG